MNTETMELSFDTDTVEEKKEIQETKPEIQLQNENSLLVKKAQGIVIASDAENTVAAEFLTSIKGAAKKVKDFFADSKKKAHEAWKAVCGNEAKMLSPLEQAEEIVKKKISAYIETQNRLRFESERKAAEEAARLQKQADKAMKKGDTEMGESLQLEAAMTVAQVAYIPQKNEGISMRYSWNWEVEDITKIPREYLTVDAGLLDSIAKTQKADANSKPADFLRKIPGIKFFTKSTIAAKAR
ncbi:MAG: hypothetical protein A2017_18160 [Lentisphaerae bacterium GWF2_44_16]|nr:MAG: hypothetical protein A2017_18160 [Lentisphaerae bacterium GWF2_44_16]